MFLSNLCIDNYHEKMLNTVTGKICISTVPRCHYTLAEMLISKKEVILSPDKDSETGSLLYMGRKQNSGATGENNLTV